MLFHEEVVDMELIDEIKSQLPIPAYASRDLSRYLVKNGKDIMPDTEVNYHALKSMACLYAKSREA